MNAVARAIAMRFLGQRGSIAVEYALLITLIAAAIIGAGYVVGSRLAPVFDAVSTRTATTGPAPPPAHGTVAPPGRHYEDCDAARAAGAAPIHAGDPGYSLELDPDGDGVGCE